MVDINTFPFEKTKFELLKNFSYGNNWPVVYIQEDGQEMYIGQTTDVYTRSLQHYENPLRAKLKRIHILTDNEFNMSAAYDLESLLIQYISADGIFKLQNGNGGLINHNYYEKEKYLAKLETVWPKLKEKSLVKEDLSKIRNSEFFKFSPYKALMSDQLLVAEKLEDEIKKLEQNTYIVHGGPGTGKSVLAIYLLKRLKENLETKDLDIALLIPMSSLRSTLTRVVKRVPGLGAEMIIGPSDLSRKTYDLLIVDEAHRLSRRINLSNYPNYEATNAQLGLKKDATQLDWIMKTSKQQILFYDEGQNVIPKDVRPSDFKHLKAQHYILLSQLRVEGGENYLEFIDDLFSLKNSYHKFSDKYDFKIYDDLNNMIIDIKKHDKNHSLSRVVAGYAWPWKTKKGKQDYDIEIDGLKLVWNSTNIDWVNSPNAINEVGCIHTIQGYDLNYAGVIIGPEISYDKENNSLIVDEKKYMDINGKRSITDPDELKQYIINIYKTLLTRGIKGTYVYIVDAALREKFKKLNEF